MRERPLLFQRLKPRQAEIKTDFPKLALKENTMNNEIPTGATEAVRDEVKPDTASGLLKERSAPPQSPTPASLPAKVVGQLKDASQDIIDLVNARISLLKMDVVDIASQTIVILIFSIIALLGTAFMFICLAWVAGDALQNRALGFLLVGALMLGIGCTAVWFKRDVSAAFVRGIIDDLINKTT